MNSMDSFQIEKIDNIVVVTLGPEYDTLDGVFVKRAETKLLAAIEESSCQYLVLDMSHTRFFGSAFIETLIRVWNQLKSRGKSEMQLCGLQPYCREVLSITHLDQIWGIQESREAALEHLQSAQA